MMEVSMEMFRRTIGLKLILLALCAASLSLTATRAVAQKEKTETGNSWKWEWNDDGWKKRLEIRGKAEFTDDYVDISRISEEGSVIVEEIRGGAARRLEIKPEPNGQLRRVYYFNNQPRAIDDDGRAWAARILLEAVRQSAIDADKRVQRIFERKGLNGVLEEISLTQGDYAKRKYFEALLKNRSLNSSALQTVLREAARQISSDYDQAQLLINASDLLVGKAEVLPAFFEAAATLKSDYERRQVLSAVMKKFASNREVLTWAAKTAARFSSDYEKGLVLRDVAAVGLEDQTVAAAFFQTLSTISSDYEHRGVLSSIFKKGRPGAQVLTRMLDSAARMSSDYEKATFLLEASRALANDASLRNSFMRTVDTIKSDYERGRVLVALQKNR
jgi:hypothetical protein